MDAQEAVELSLHGALILYGVRVLDRHTVAIPASNLDVAGLADVALSGLKFAGYEVVKPELGKLSADWLAQAQRYPEATRKFATDLLAAGAAAEKAGQ